MMTSKQLAERLQAACKGALAALSQNKTYDSDINYARRILRDAIEA